MVEGVHRKEAGVDGVLHRLEQGDEYIRFVTCFPRSYCSDDVLYERLRWLRKLGIEYFVETGRVFLGYRVLGKGYSSITVLGKHRDHGIVAVKIRRLDSRRKTLEYEGMVLDYLSPTGFVPYLYVWSRDFIVMEYVGCSDLVDYLYSIGDDERIHILRRTLSSLYILDLFGIDHTELNRPHGHMFWCGSTIKVIDWESARPLSKPHNLTMFASYIFIRRNILNMNDEELDHVKKLLRLYKKDPAKGLVGLFRLLEQS